MVEPVGRRREQEAMLDALARAERGRRTVIHVVGDAGMGKSTLVEGLLAATARRGHRTLVGGLTAAETDLSWAGLATLLRHVPPSALDALPGPQRRALSTALGVAEGNVEALVVATAFAGVLTALAEQTPVTVVIDDLHWLDRATAGALSFAVRSLESSPVAFVFAGRPVALPLEPARLVPADQLVELRLEGLSVAGMRAILDERCGVQLGRIDLIGVHGITSGNPMHAIEVGRLLAAGRSTADALPPSLQAAVTARLALLSPSTLAPLRVAALAATPRRSVLARLFSAAEVTAAVLEAERADLLTVHDDLLQFRHPTIVAGLIEGMGVFERRDLRLRLAAVLDDEEERAVLSASAADAPDATIAAALERAAATAHRRGALHLAAQHARRAWELTPDDLPDDRRRRRMHTANILVAAGEPRRARAVYDELLAGPLDDDTLWEVTHGHIICTAHLDGEAAAAAEIDALLAAAGTHLDRRLEAYGIATRVQLMTGDRAASSAVASMVDLVRGHDDPDLLLEAQAMEAIVAVLRGDPYDVDGLIERCVRHWGAPSVEVGSRLAEVLVWTDRLDIAPSHLERALDDAEQRGNLVALMNQLDQLADACSRAGRWAEAEQHYERYIDLSLAAGGITSVASRHAEMAGLDAVRGRREAAVSRLRLAVDTTRPATRLDTGQLAARAGTAWLLLGDPVSAVPLLLDARATLGALGVVDPGALPYQADLVEALLAVGRVDDASSVVADLRVVAERSHRPRARVEAGRAGALLAAATGDLATAEAAWADAAAAVATLPLPFEHARTAMVGGIVARRAGRRTDARARLEAAREGFERLGALGFVARADEELARCGHEPGEAGALTPTERQIADLVGRGRTNAEIAAALFISVRTVESNLTKVYRKLGLRSRTELVRHLRDQRSP